jgi:hypothetical protein
MVMFDVPLYCVQLAISSKMLMNVSILSMLTLFIWRMQEDYLLTADDYSVHWGVESRTYN